MRHRGIRTTVCRDLCQWRIRVHGRDIDDSRMLFRRHITAKNLGRDQCAEEIELEHEIDAFGIELKEVLDVWVVDLVCIKVFIVSRCGWIVDRKSTRLNSSHVSISYA